MELQLTAFTVCVALVVGLLCYIFAVRGRDKSANWPPGEVSLARSFIAPSSIPAYFDKLRQDPRPIYRSMVYSINQVVVNDADCAKRLLPRDGDAIASSWPRTTSSLLGPNSFVVLHGPPHRAVRKQLAQAFSSQAIEEYLPHIQRLVEHRLALWQAAGQIKLHDEARLLTFEVMARVVAGCKLDEGELVRLSRHFDTFTKGLFFVTHIDLPWTAYGKAVRSKREIQAAISTQLDLIAAEKGAGGREGGVGCLLAELAAGVDHEGKPLSRETVLDNGVALLFAGHETTAITLTVLLWLLLDRPDVWQRLREEQQAVVARHGTAITGEAIRDMPYVDAVVKEGWRWHPIVGSVPRRSLKTHDLEGYTVPKGWGYVINYRKMIHSDPRWEAAGVEGRGPKDFTPERWLGPEGGGLGVLPGVNSLVFGGGGRSCLGAPLAWAEIKVIMATLARSYEVSSALDHRPTWTEVPISFEAGLPLVIEPLAA